MVKVGMHRLKLGVDLPHGLIKQAFILHTLLDLGCGSLVYGFGLTLLLEMVADKACDYCTECNSLETQPGPTVFNYGLAHSACKQGAQCNPWKWVFGIHGQGLRVPG
ncbi:MAG: hypothetical protein HPY30_05110 [Gammaproteobacteria bacterium (ex Lamellibrachia satsuma)]|nr:MAG: hypothetical protein HPY30_05110 [Gammaproteobacteria bacterium (ex Lamellibrachia satsuma)]